MEAHHCSIVKQETVIRSTRASDAGGGPGMMVITPPPNKESPPPVSAIGGDVYL